MLSKLRIPLHLCNRSCNRTNLCLSPSVIVCLCFFISRMLRPCIWLELLLSCQSLVSHGEAVLAAIARSVPNPTKYDGQKNATPPPGRMTRAFDEPLHRFLRRSRSEAVRRCQRHGVGNPSRTAAVRGGRAVVAAKLRPLLGSPPPTPERIRARTFRRVILLVAPSSQQSRRRCRHSCRIFQGIVRIPRDEDLVVAA